MRVFWKSKGGSKGGGEAGKKAGEAERGKGPESALEKTLILVSPLIWVLLSGLLT